MLNPAYTALHTRNESSLTRDDVTIPLIAKEKKNKYDKNDEAAPLN